MCGILFFTFSFPLGLCLIETLEFTVTEYDQICLRDFTDTYVKLIVFLIFGHDQEYSISQNILIATVFKISICLLNCPKPLSRVALLANFN